MEKFNDNGNFSFLYCSRPMLDPASENLEIASLSQKVHLKFRTRMARAQCFWVGKTLNDGELALSHAFNVQVVCCGP